MLDIVNHTLAAEDPKQHKEETTGDHGRPRETTGHGDHARPRETKPPTKYPLPLPPGLETIYRTITDKPFRKNRKSQRELIFEGGGRERERENINKKMHCDIICSSSKVHKFNN